METPPGHASFSSLTSFSWFSFLIKACGPSTELVLTHNSGLQDSNRLGHSALSKLPSTSLFSPCDNAVLNAPWGVYRGSWSQRPTFATLEVSHASRILSWLELGFLDGYWMSGHLTSGHLAIGLPLCEHCFSEISLMESWAPPPGATHPVVLPCDHL